MTNKTFSITIHASPATVWQVLWNDESYREWTSVFAPDSHAITDWKQGSKVLFVDSNNNGMISHIKELVPNAKMTFEHLGEVTNGTEDTISEQAKQWAGAIEEYILKPSGNHTELSVSMDMADEFVEEFAIAFPKGLEKVKQMAEAREA